MDGNFDIRGNSTGSVVGDLIDIAVESGADDVFYVGDLGVVREQIRKFRRYLPEVTPYYAVKCNPDVEVLKLLATLGVNFDIASIAELEAIRSILENNAEQMGTRVIYANPVKSFPSLALAASYGVSLLVFDSIDELEKIANSCSASTIQNKISTRLLLRIAVDDSTSLVPLAGKFGASLSEVPALLEKAHELNLDVVGVAFHVGSGARSLKPYVSAFKDARCVFDTAASLGYFEFSVLDIGGGFSGYDDESPVTFREICGVINKHIRELFADVYDGLEVIAEPGRFVVAAAFSLAAKVVGARERNAADEKKMEYVIADGIYGSFKDALLLNVNYQVEVITQENCDEKAEEDECGSTEEKDMKSTVFGPSLDRFDVVLRDKMMREMKTGDWIVFHNMGAYTISLASQLGGIPPPRVYYLQ